MILFYLVRYLSHLTWSSQHNHIEIHPHHQLPISPSLRLLKPTPPPQLPSLPFPGYQYLSLFISNAHLRYLISL